MARVDVVIHGRTYPVQCDDGQEDHVRRLASRLDAAAAEISGGVSSMLSDAHLLVLSSLMLLDEAETALQEAASPKGAEGLPLFDEAAATVRVQEITARIEALAQRQDRS